MQGASDEAVAPHGDSEPKYSEEGIPAEGNPDGGRWGVRAKHSDVEV